MSTMSLHSYSSGMVQENSNMSDIDYLMTTIDPFGFSNDTGNVTRCRSVHDKEYNKKIRIINLYITLILGTLGGIMVLAWMSNNRRLKTRMNSLSRVNSFILNLTIADLAVMFLAVLTQLIWEYQDNREWRAGAFLCKMVKFCQSFTLMASTNMLVVIAIDRHQAILRPLKTPIAVWKMAGAGWAVAALGSLPMLYVFRTNVVGGVQKCENIFRDLPRSHRKAFLTYAAVIVFLIPICLLIFCYTSIFLKIARKAKESQTSKRHSIKPGKIHLQSTNSNSLPKAKIKTLKMTFVIVVVFLVCGIPYFIAEMIMSYGDHCIISDLVYGIIGALAAANSAANPYVFLLFNCNGRYSRDRKRSSSEAIGNSTTRTVYSTASTRSDYVGDSKAIYQPSIKYKWNANSQNSMEMNSMR
ncbi:cephalotocin receptor 2-like [Ylistrum balloti]|uniref:cephalotocin receptor 2-like n=1 Tax=Ylistrum balloti TaxID=509963 RepID=UPI002905DF1E|nr:cephalotocin receptor 2-like [Ylistrum balloti]